MDQSQVKIDPSVVLAIEHSHFDRYLPFVPDAKYPDDIARIISQDPSAKQFFTAKGDLERSEEHLRAVYSLISQNQPPGRCRTSPTTKLTFLKHDPITPDVPGPIYKSRFLLTLTDDIPISERKDFRLAKKMSDGLAVDATDVAVFGEIETSNAAHPYCLPQPARSTCLQDHNVIAGVTLSITNCIYGDAARRFSYALSLDGECLRFWYISQSHCGKSDPIVWSKHRGVFIKVLSSFLWASMEELGYDTSIWRLDNGQYIYELDWRFFRTTDCISEFRTQCIPGRATRVWKVVEVEQTGTLENPAFDVKKGTLPTVLKDCWIDVNAKTEYEIQETIFVSLEELRQALMRHDSAHQGPKHVSDFLAAAQETFMEYQESDSQETWFQEIVNEYRQSVDPGMFAENVDS